MTEEYYNPVTFQYRGMTIWKDAVACYVGAPCWFAARSIESLPDTDEDPFPEEPEYFSSYPTKEALQAAIDKALGPDVDEPQDAAYWDARRDEDGAAGHEADYLTAKMDEL